MAYNRFDPGCGCCGCGIFLLRSAIETQEAFQAVLDAASAEAGTLQAVPNPAGPGGRPWLVSLPAGGNWEYRDRLPDSFWTLAVDPLTPTYPDLSVACFGDGDQVLWEAEIEPLNDPPGPARLRLAADWTDEAYAAGIGPTFADDVFVGAFQRLISHLYVYDESIEWPLPFGSLYPLPQWPAVARTLHRPRGSSGPGRLRIQNRSEAPIVFDSLIADRIEPQPGGLCDHRPKSFRVYVDNEPIAISGSLSIDGVALVPRITGKHPTAIGGGVAFPPPETFGYTSDPIPFDPRVSTCEINWQQIETADGLVTADLTMLLRFTEVGGSMRWVTGSLATLADASFWQTVFGDPRQYQLSYDSGRVSTSFSGPVGGTASAGVDPRLFTLTWRLRLPAWPRGGFPSFSLGTDDELGPIGSGIEILTLPDTEVLRQTSFSLVGTTPESGGFGLDIVATDAPIDVRAAIQAAFPFV